MVQKRYDSMREEDLINALAKAVDGLVHANIPGAPRDRGAIECFVRNDVGHLIKNKASGEAIETLRAVFNPVIFTPQHTRIDRIKARITERMNLCPGETAPMFEHLEIGQVAILSSALGYAQTMLDDRESSKTTSQRDAAREMLKGMENFATQYQCSEIPAIAHELYERHKPRGRGHG